MIFQRRVIPFELLSTAVREGTADDNIPFHKVENLRSQDMKWLSWIQVRQDFWFLLQYSSFHGGRSTEDRGKGGKDKGLFEERGVGKKQNGRHSCAKPMALCKQRQASANRCVPEYFVWAPSLTSGEQIRMRGTICHKGSGVIEDEQACLGMRIEV